MPRRSGRSSGLSVGTHLDQAQELVRLLFPSPLELLEALRLRRLAAVLRPLIEHQQVVVAQEVVRVQLEATPQGLLGLLEIPLPQVDESQLGERVGIGGVGARRSLARPLFARDLSPEIEDAELARPPLDVGPVNPRVDGQDSRRVLDLLCQLPGV